MFFGLGLLALFVGFLLVSLVSTPYTHEAQMRGAELVGPSLSHLAGTDVLGRDLFIRLIVGSLISMGIAVIASAVNLTIGLAYGVSSGYVGGKIDAVMMRAADVISSIPEILYLVLIMIFIKDAGLFAHQSGLLGIVLTLSIAFWIPFARILRSHVLSLRQRDFITAARLYGASHMRIVFKYILPNCLPLMLVTVATQIPVAIFFESFLSFIGLGVEPPLPSLGGLLADGLGGMQAAPHLLLFPVVWLALIMFIFNLIADGLRDHFDKHLI